MILEFSTNTIELECLGSGNIHLSKNTNENDFKY